MKHEEETMLGLGSWDTALAYWLCIGCALGCVAYGLLKWNDAGVPDTVSIDDILPDGRDADQ